MNRADVRVIQGGGGLRFALEAVECMGVLRQGFGQELECDKAVKPRVFGLVDYTHPAAAELFQDAIVGNRLADHGKETNYWAVILGRVSR